MELKTLNPASLTPPLNAVLIKDAAGLDQVHSFFSRSDVFGFDTETNVTKTFVDRKCRLIQVGNKDEQYVIDLLAFSGSTAALMEQGGTKTPGWATDLVEVLKEGLESDKHLKVGTNLQFDYEVLWWCLGMRPFNFWDCLRMEQILNAGKVRLFARDFWALDDMVGRYCRCAVDKSLQKSFDLESELTPEQVAYAALDTRLPLSIMRGQQKKIDALNLQVIAQLENDAIPAFGDLHLNGVLLNTDAWMVLVNETKAQHAENVKTLDNHFICVVGSKSDHKPADLQTLEDDWRNTKDRELRAECRKKFQEAARTEKAWAKAVETFEGEAAINYGSGDQLLDAFRKMGFGPRKLRDTNDKSLKALDDPAIKALRAYRKTAKILSTYGESFLEHIEPSTGRIHPHFNQIGADTGRTSCTSPNLQNIPRGSAFRKCFIARPGYKLITIDCSGCELRIIAESSGEKIWIDAFLQGHDLHSVGAEILFGDKWKNAALPDCAYYHKNKSKCSCPGHKLLRNQVKAINFGIAYGMEADTLAERLDITRQEAELLLSTYKEKFRGVMNYLDASGKFAKMNFRSYTLGGRIRFFERPDWNACAEWADVDVKKRRGDDAKALPKDTSRRYYAQYSSIEREGKNSPIQGTNADLVKLAMGCGEGYLWRTLYTKFGGLLVNMVHDELVIEVPEENAKECFEFTADCIAKAGAAFLKTVPMTSEGEIADYWTK